MKITLSKSQWEMIGKKTGWIKKNQFAKIANISASQLIDILQDPNCKPSILAEILKGGKDNVFSWNAASNPNCPPEVLAEVLKRGKNDMVSRYAAMNSKSPPEALAEVLARNENNYVSQHAAFNPNCPKEAKLKWMNADRH